MSNVIKLLDECQLKSFENRNTLLSATFELIVILQLKQVCHYFNILPKSHLKWIFFSYLTSFF